MGKRRNGQPGTGAKRRRIDVVDPQWQGIFVTCPRGREHQCRREIMQWLEEAVEELWPSEDVSDDDKKPSGDDEEVEEDIEAQIKKEVEGLKGPSKDKRLVAFDSLGCECLVFIRTKRPIIPTKLVEHMCMKSLEGTRSVQYAQRLSPVEIMAPVGEGDIATSMARFQPLLEQHFGDSESQKFAIRPTIRLQTKVDRMQVIQALASQVGKCPGNHTVDLKNYSKILLVECFKGVLGISIAGSEYDNTLCRFNVAQIQDRHARQEQ